MNDKNRYIILTTMLLQSSMLMVIDFTIIGSNSLNSLKKTIPLFNIMIAMTTVFMLFSFKKTYYYIKKETELKITKTNMKNAEELLELLRSQRHDYIGHIQAISSLVYIEEYKELSDYIEGISKEYRFISEIIRLGDPTLTALINIKKQIAEEKGIFFDVQCIQKISSLEINSWELSSLMSNLIENAIEATMTEKGNRWIKFTCDYSNNNYIFQVENAGQITNVILESMFNSGFSTKSSVGRGYGLFIVKKIVNKYKGFISCENTKQNSVKIIVTLPGKDAIDDKKSIY